MRDNGQDVLTESTDKQILEMVEKDQMKVGVWIEFPKRDYYQPKVIKLALKKNLTIKALFQIIRTRLKISPNSSLSISLNNKILKVTETLGSFQKHSQGKWVKLLCNIIDSFG